MIVSIRYLPSVGIEAAIHTTSDTALCGGVARASSSEHDRIIAGERG